MNPKPLEAPSTVPPAISVRLMIFTVVVTPAVRESPEDRRRKAVESGLLFSSLDQMTAGALAEWDWD